LIRDLELEAEREPRELSKFAKVSLPKPPRGSIFVGAGDSYAAALAGFYASGGRCIALDPYALASEPEAADGAEVFFVSVSGTTSSNVLASAKVRGRAKRTVAITAVGGSPLAKSTDATVLLPFEYVPRTSGLLSFALSGLAVLKMVGAVGRCDFQRMFDEAKVDRVRLELAKGTTYFLGNSLAHAAAIYSSAKVYEILGARAHAEALEEFSHMELFSLRRSDVVTVFSAFDPAGLSKRLRGSLAKEGFRSTAVPERGRSAAESFFHSVFVAQLWCLAEARRKGLTKPRFLGAKGLRVSDSMIY
jgi:fructoselysine-6-P-deglycase FrlB-like protein